MRNLTPAFPNAGELVCAAEVPDMLWMLCFSLTAAIFAAPPASDPESARAVQQAWAAESLHDQMRLRAAASAYQQAIASLTDQFGEAHPRTLIALNNEAAALLKLNRPAEAEVLLRDALSRRERAGLPDDINMAVTLANLGEAFLEQHRTEAAIQMHERALELKRKLKDAGPAEIATSLTNLAEALRQAGQLTRARKLLDEAVEKFTAHAQGHTGAAAHPLMPGYAHAMNTLGLIHDDEGHRKQAEQAYAEALAASLRTFGPQHDFTATLHLNLAGHYLQYNDWKSADLHCRQAIEGYELEPGHETDPNLAMALRMHAGVLDHLRGRRSEAESQRKRAASILSLR